MVTDICGKLAATTYITFLSNGELEFNSGTNSAFVNVDPVDDTLPITVNAIKTLLSGESYQSYHLRYTLEHYYAGRRRAEYTVERI